MRKVTKKIVNHQEKWVEKRNGMLVIDMTASRCTFLFYRIVSVAFGLTKADCLVRTNVSACTTLCASVWVDRVDVTC